MPPKECPHILHEEDGYAGKLPGNKGHPVSRAYCFAEQYKPIWKPLHYCRDFAVTPGNR